MALIDDPDPERQGGAYDQAITDLYIKHDLQVMKYLRRLGVPKSDAEEIRNDSFLAARLYWEKVQHYKEPEAYVYKVARNCTAKYFGKMSSDQPLPPDEALPDGAVVDLTRSDAIIDLRNAMARLSPKERDCVVLHYLQGFKHREIGFILDRTEGDVARTLSDARKRLRPLLDEDDSGEGA